MHKIFSLRIRGFQKSVIALSLSLVSTSLFADAAEKICPLPIGLQASTGVSKEAINAKITNISKSALQLKIPKATPDNEWLTSLMLEISDEVYDYPTLRPEVYAAYRFEVCFVKQQHQDQVVNLDFAKAHPLLQECELIPEEGARPSCAMRVVHKISGMPE